MSRNVGFPDCRPGLGVLLETLLEANDDANSYALAGVGSNDFPVISDYLRRALSPFVENAMGPGARHE